MKKSILWFIVLLVCVSLIATFSLIGCKEDVPTTEEAEAEEEVDEAEATEEVAEEAPAEETAVERVPVTIWCWGEASWTIDEIEASFEAENPNIDLVKVEMGPWDLLDKLLASMATGEDLPDVAEMVRRMFQPYMESGKMMDLTEKATKYKDGFTEGSIAEVTYDGKIYGMPTETSYTVMVINMEAFEEAGIDYTSLVTWDDYIGAGKVLRENDKYLMNLIVPAGAAGMMQWNMYFMSLGGNIFTEDGKVIRDNELARDTFKWYRDVLGPVSLLAPHPNSDPTVFTELNAGTIAAYGLDTAQLKSVELKAPDLEGKLTIVPWPVWSEGSEKLLGRWGGSAFTIPDEAEHKEEAWTFLEYITTADEGTQAMWEYGGLITSYRPGWELPALREPLEFFNDVVYLDSLTGYNAAPPYYWIDWAQTQDIVGVYIDKMFDGSMTPEEAWDTCEEELVTKLGR